MVARLDRVQKRYNRLTDMERFQLALAAEIRQDFTQARKLNDAVERVTYRMVALPYGNMRKALIGCMMTQALEILGVGSMLAWRYGTYLACSSKNQARTTQTGDYMAMKQMAEVVWVLWQAIALFAEDLGIELDHALYMMPSRPQVDLVVRMAEGVLNLEEEIVQSVIDRKPEDERAVIRKERAQNTAYQRQKKVRQSADLLQQLWKLQLES